MSVQLFLLLNIHKYKHSQSKKQKKKHPDTAQLNPYSSPTPQALSQICACRFSPRKLCSPGGKFTAASLAREDRSKGGRWRERDAAKHSEGSWGFSAFGFFVLCVCVRVSFACFLSVGLAFSGSLRRGGGASLFCEGWCLTSPLGYFFTRAFLFPIQVY